MFEDFLYGRAGFESTFCVKFFTTAFWLTFILWVPTDVELKKHELHWTHFLLKYFWILKERQASSRKSNSQLHNDGCRPNPDDFSSCWSSSRNFRSKLVWDGRNGCEDASHHQMMLRWCVCEKRKIDITSETFYKRLWITASLRAKDLCKVSWNCPKRNFKSGHKYERRSSESNLIVDIGMYYEKY